MLFKGDTLGRELSYRSIFPRNDVYLYSIHVSEFDIDKLPHYGNIWGSQPGMFYIPIMISWELEDGYVITSTAWYGI